MRLTTRDGVKKITPTSFCYDAKHSQLCEHSELYNIRECYITNLNFCGANILNNAYCLADGGYNYCHYQQLRHEGSDA